MAKVGEPKFIFDNQKDIEFLKKVVEVLPYGVGYGCKEKAWVAMAANLKKNLGYDMSFKLCKDRASSVLDCLEEVRSGFAFLYLVLKRMNSMITTAFATASWKCIKDKRSLADVIF
jgi:hypothetical protein